MYSIKQLNSICAYLGGNKLYVQGAGGNVSEKSSKNMLIKASGMWLSDAEYKDIYTEVDLDAINLNIKLNKFDIIINPLKPEMLRPSIETIVHALIPRKFIVHIHHINSIAHLVLNNCEDIISKKLNNYSYPYQIIEYVKPGADLGRVIHQKIKLNPKAKVFLLKNHGVFFSSNDLNEISKQIEELDKLLYLRPRKIDDELTFKSYKDLKNIVLDDINYFPIPSDLSQSLVYDCDIKYFLDYYWCLYPDHIVFLGPKAYWFKSVEEFKSNYSKLKPKIIFIKNYGVFTSEKVTDAILDQTDAYSNVIYRLNRDFKVNCLTQDEISELLNWDSEKYRVNLSR